MHDIEQEMINKVKSDTLKMLIEVNQIHNVNIQKLEGNTDLLIRTNVLLMNIHTLESLILTTNEDIVFISDLFEKMEHSINKYKNLFVKKKTK